ncbi:hypothetical protein Poli38472_006161 [Pythium oligandrum]|uniref:Bromo domain-containing protein n=1 Tax=Pythium oligandrum TaxID=41045 RepID=A0A8K1CUW3_PYTOL|nr:hypothetical protein Poli38472_006161 [Pythium oligandrum]|eukprot:TMW68693.1 hypothetical protein Poli38472_006161 [Pythium oligandrum]
MALTDIMAMDMNGKYVHDSSSSSSMSDSDSDSDDLSSSSSSSSSSSMSSRNSSPASSPVAMRKTATAAGKAKPKPRAAAAKARQAKARTSSVDEDSDFEHSLPKPKKKRAAPVKRATAPAAKKTKKQVNAPPAPPSPSPPPPPPLSPPLSPPPPPPPLDTSESSSSSSGISSDSSSSSSSSDSDDSEEVTHARVLAALSNPASTASARAAPSSAKTKQSSTDALKVKLKLPPGFIAKHPEGAAPKTALNDRGKLKVQVTNSRPAAKKPRTTSTTGAARKKSTPTAAKTASTAKKTKKAASTAPTAPTEFNNGAFGDGVPLPPANLTATGAILPHLIPKGPTIPSQEVRGKKELSFADEALSMTRPEEVEEKDIPADFNDPFPLESDALRILDMFFFCDEDGNAIGLEILERPKEERPRIMGFGTVVQHLPVPERPIPVKYILPSPAFPSRSRKRPRTDSTGTTPTKSPKARSTAKSARKTSTKKTTPKKSSAPIPQTDGVSDDVCNESATYTGSSIFDHTSVYAYSVTEGASQRLSQWDGQSDSDSSDSGSDSDSSSSNSSTNSVRSEDPSDLSSSDSDSGSDTGRDSASEHDIPRSISPASPALSNGSLTPVPEAKAKKPNSSPRQGKSSQPAKKRRASSNGTGSPSKPASTNPDVNELMRTDREARVEARGTSDELNLLECGFRHPPEYQRLRVWLPEITDWCLDYSEGDPTLWVITPHAWYKIAGPLSGVLPHPSYRTKFQHVRKLFEASYLVAYVLKEWLPINKKVSYRATLQQIVELSLKSRYPVSAWFLMENFHFIQHQICDLVADKESYLESMFFKQLQRLHEGYQTRVARVRKELAQREQRRVQREDERLKKRQQVEEERKKLHDRKEEERKLKEAERKYPIEDLELLGDENVAENAHQFPLPPSEWLGVNGSLLGDLIMAWQTISTFKNFIQLDDSLSLEELASSITSSWRGEDGSELTLVRIFIALLRVILSEKSFVSPMDDLVVEGSTTVADLFVNMERTYGICERPYLELLNAITWQDILRQLMAKDLGIDASIGSVETLVGCEIVRQTLYMQNNSVPFNAPVDTKLKGLEDYPQIIKRPMDLGTIKQNLDAGVYEGPNGHEAFASDVRLIWDNAVLYNGEESDVGRAALGLSDIFEQDYQRLVVGRIIANKERLEATRLVEQLLQDPNSDTALRPNFVDIVHGLYAVEFNQLPVAFKIGALSWLCSEFLKLESVRTHLEAQAEREFDALREHRKKTAEIDTLRKASEKNRREREATFRKECIEQGIQPNGNNQFSDAVKEEHPFIAAFYKELQEGKLADESSYEAQKKEVDAVLKRSLKAVVVRESPVGKDRFHNSYWMFANDSRPRLFIEKNDSGEFIVCNGQADFDTLIQWFNPKGIREVDLLSKLNAVKSKLLGEEQVEATIVAEGDTKKEEVDKSVTLNLFPLPGEPLKSEDKLVLREGDRLQSAPVLQQMLLRIEKHFQCTSITSTEADHSAGWKSRVQAASTCQELQVLLAELEAAIVGSRGAEDTIRVSWKRKRREWQLSLEGSRTFSQVVFLLHLFLAECINVEAFMDLSIRLERKDWIKLRPKESRNFIPEVGKHVVYFGDGHAQALKEDAKTKKKRFTRKSDPPIHKTTLLCTVAGISYYHGGGDPYALLVIHPADDLQSHAIVRQEGSFLCPQPSPLQRLARTLQRIVTKIKLNPDAGPFLEPVSDRDFPEYKEIIPHPMDLSKISAKIKGCEYKSVDSFLSDVKLMSSNCTVFCEGRFPALPPLARNLVDLAEGFVKKAQKELRSYEKAIQGDNAVKPEEANGSATAENPTSANGKDTTGLIGDLATNVKKEEAPVVVKKDLVVILRLENRLPEYLVDLKRYETAVTRSWHCGEKFRILFRNPQGFPGEYYGGVTAGSLPFASNGLLPWEALRVVWDEDDGSDDSRINPWEAEIVPENRKSR